MAHHPPLTEGEFYRIREIVNAFVARTGITDTELARKAGIDQPMVHTVRHGLLKKRTPRLTRLELYICMESDIEHPLLQDMQRAVRTFIAAGGDVAFLPKGIAMLAGAQVAANLAA